MSVGSKSLPARRRAGEEGGETSGGAVVREENKEQLEADADPPKAGGGGGSGSSSSLSRKQKAARYDRCFSGLELSIGPGPLRDVDAGRLKGQIRRWAKAVVAFARQISFGSPRSRGGGSRASSRSASMPAAADDGRHTTRSATFAASSRSSRLGPGGANDNEPPTT